VKADTHAENQDDGGIDGTTHQIHLPAVGTGGLQIIDAHADEREARGIDENVDHRPQIIVYGTESELHLYHILYRQTYDGCYYHPS